MTQDWDHKELMIGSNGPEANDRTHQIRAYGYYQIDPQWLVSANVLIQSGRPKNCIGVYPGEIPSEINYGASYFYCKGEPTPRGSKGRLPWTYRLDLGVQYAPSFANNNLTFTATVVNVFNKQTVQSINESGETGSGAPNLSYQQPLSYQTPRYVQFGARYDFSL